MNKFYVESLETMKRTAPEFRKGQFVKVSTDEMARLIPTQVAVTDKINFFAEQCRR